jgi:hypothetical protein
MALRKATGNWPARVRLTRIRMQVAKLGVREYTTGGCLPADRGGGIL